jgi:hemoglobin
MKRSISIGLVSLALPLVFAASIACGSKKPKVVEPPPVEIVDAGPVFVEAEAPAPKSLFERLGKKDGLTAVVESFLKNVKADAAVSKSFAKTTGPKEVHFKQMLVEQLCEATGGDCKYSGKPMKEAHKDTKITDKQWDAFVTDLTLALDEQKVGSTEKVDLFALIAPMKGDMVEPAKKK